MLKSANSPRPASWILERSLDGVSFEAWQYFGRSDADCRQRYGMPGQNGKYVFANDTEVICTTQFSKPLPLENGELHVSLVKNRPGAMIQAPELMSFIRARYLRIRFQGMHSTANLDNSVYWQLDAQSLQKRSFYSLKQIRISGRLDCHGHAEVTEEFSKVDQQNSKDSMLKCVCQHNTCGSDCSECCPLFQDKPFRLGTTLEANECEPCQCHGHSNTCLYELFIEKGVCQNCQNNTRGVQCELCAEGYYRRQDATLGELILTTSCLPCECQMKGSTGTCDAQTGSCICREGFQGKRCEECAPGYSGDDCFKCNCNNRGTISGSECSEQCVCKTNVQGDACDECKIGFYDLTSENIEGCSRCWCSNIGLSCTNANVSTLSFETLSDWHITNIKRSQLLVPSVCDDTRYLTYSMYEMSDVESIYWTAPQGYLGNRLTSYSSRLSIHVSWVTIRGDTSGKPTVGPNVILCGRNGFTIAHGNGEFSGDSSATINITLDENGWYLLTEDLLTMKTSQRSHHSQHQRRNITRGQFLSILSSLEALLIRASFHTDQVETSLERAIIYTGGNQLGGTSATRIEQCVCPSGYTGLSCESCEFGYIRTFENDTLNCKPCPCNGHSASCDLQSGGCGFCMHNTFGDR